MLKYFKEQIKRIFIMLISSNPETIAKYKYASDILPALILDGVDNFIYFYLL